MRVKLEDWPRSYYQREGGRPFVFYAVFGEFPNLPALDSAQYRTLGVPPGLILSSYDRREHPDVLSGFEMGYPWDELTGRDPGVARLVSESSRCLILQGELEDQEDLNYLRDSVGLLTFLLDQGGVCVYDPQMFRWWNPTEWRRDVFEPDGPLPRRHVVVLTSAEEGMAPRDAPLTWFHTRGLRKFGRPDLSVHDVPPHLHEAVIDLLERFIGLQALGGVIDEGQEIRMRSLPPGMTCHHAGDVDDPDFNNVHVEISPPR